MHILSDDQFIVRGNSDLTLAQFLAKELWSATDGEVSLTLDLAPGVSPRCRHCGRILKLKDHCTLKLRTFYDRRILVSVPRLCCRCGSCP